MSVIGTMRRAASRSGLGGVRRRLARAVGGEPSGPIDIETTNVIDAGRHSQHNGNLRILGRQPIRIGSYCALGRDIMMVTENHDTNFLAVQGAIYRRVWDLPHPGATQTPPNPERTRGGITIGNDVWIGDRCTVLSGVTIGDGACLGANSVVTRDVPPYAVGAGVPARVLKQRFPDDIVEILLDIGWWEWDDERLARNRELFTTNLNAVSAEQLRALIS